MVFKRKLKIEQRNFHAYSLLIHFFLLRNNKGRNSFYWNNILWGFFDTNLLVSRLGFKFLLVWLLHYFIVMKFTFLYKKYCVVILSKKTKKKTVLSLSSGAPFSFAFVSLLLFFVLLIRLRHISGSGLEFLSGVYSVRRDFFNGDDSASSCYKCSNMLRYKHKM